jgi:hypothetical protein
LYCDGSASTQHADGGKCRYNPFNGYRSGGIAHVLDSQESIVDGINMREQT